MLDMKNKTAFSTSQPRTNVHMGLVIGLVLFLILGASFIQFYQGHQRLELMKHQVEELNERVQTIKYEKQKLLTMLDQLGTMEYVERIAREELGLVKKGEILIITLDE